MKLPAKHQKQNTTGGHQPQGQASNEDRHIRVQPPLGTEADLDQVGLRPVRRRAGEARARGAGRAALRDRAGRGPGAPGGRVLSRALDGEDPAELLRAVGSHQQDPPAPEEKAKAVEKEGRLPAIAPAAELPTEISPTSNRDRPASLDTGFAAVARLACQYRNNSTRGATATRDPSPTDPKGGRDALTERKRRWEPLYITACRENRWSIATWPKSDPSRVMFRPFRCRSWRHEGDCRWWKGAQDFVRIKEGLATYDDWLYLVFTYDQKRWAGSYDAYRAGGTIWNRLHSALRRRFGKLAYIQTWERHKTGWPHLNVVVHNEAMLAACSEPSCTHVQGKRLCAGYARLRREISALAVKAGFGFRMWLEPVRQHEAMASYINKLSKELVGAATKDQVPDNAPRHFRRIRASRGLLPPVYKNADVSGMLVREPTDLLELPRNARVERLHVLGSVSPRRGVLVAERLAGRVAGGRDVRLSQVRMPGVHSTALRPTPPSEKLSGRRKYFRCSTETLCPERQTPSQLNHGHESYRQ